MVFKKMFLVVFYLWVVPCSIAQTIPSFCLNPDDFGIVRNSPKDNSEAFQKMLDQAALTGATICLPTGYITLAKTITVQAGVTIIGSGRGATPNQTPYNGTILWYTGVGAAMVVTGSDVVLNNFTIYDKGGKASDGLLLKADNNLIESFSLINVLIFGFVSGTALHFSAQNKGGITYCSLYDLRIRHAKVGISITPEEGSFINSNSFYHGVISGGGFDTCLLMEGGNNTIFYGTVMEPYSSTYGHILIKKGQIVGENIRIEAIHQPKDKPVITLATKTKDCILTGMYSGGIILNQGQNNRVELRD